MIKACVWQYGFRRRSPGKRMHRYLQSMNANQQCCSNIRPQPSGTHFKLSQVVNGQGFLLGNILGAILVNLPKGPLRPPVMVPW